LAAIAETEAGAACRGSIEARGHGGRQLKIGRCPIVEIDPVSPPMSLRMAVPLLNV
jgi:hypothetical protein